MSARKEIQALDEYGRPLPGAKVYVYTALGALAQLTDSVGNSLEQPLETNTFGLSEYYAADGFYRHDYYFGGRKAYVEANVGVGFTGGLPIVASKSALPSLPPQGATVSITDENAIVLRVGNQWQRHFTRNWLDNQPGFNINDPVAVSTCLQLAHNELKVVELRPGATYPVMKRSDMYNNGGVVCDGARPATFLMKTGAGQFDSIDFSSLGANNRVFLAAENRSNIKVHGIDFVLEANAGIRTAFPLAIYNCTDAEVDGVRVYNFKEQDGGYIRIDLCTDCTIQNILGEDCTTDTTSLGVLQLTLVEDRNNTTGSTYRNITGRNIRLGATARAQFNSQSDVLNIQSGANADAFVENISGYRVGEVIDLWGSNCQLSNIRGEEVDLVVLKLVYGASHNVVTNIRADKTGLGVIYLGTAPPESSRPGPLKDNTVIGISATNVGSLWAAEQQPRGQSMWAGIQIEGTAQPTDALKPSGNFFSGRINGISPTIMPSVIRTENAGSSVSDTNTFRGNGRNYTAFSSYTGTTAPVAVQE